ncbi:MAG: mechanosensitive ion channel family protein, partial [Bacteroidota bacterium]
MNTQEWITKGYNLILEFTPKIVAAFLIWIIGSWIIKFIIRGFKRLMEKRHYDESLQKGISA